MIRVEVQHLLSSLGVGCVLLCTLVLAAWLWGVCIVSSGWADFAVATLFVMDPYLSSVRSSRLSSSLLFQDTSLSLPHGRLTGLQGPRASVGSLPCSWSVTMPLRALSAERAARAAELHQGVSGPSSSCVWNPRPHSHVGLAGLSASHEGDSGRCPGRADLS